MPPAPVAADPFVAAAPDAVGPSTRWLGLPPVAGARTVVLVLGSFPGAASLQARQYYAHPQNHFWKILQALWPQHPLPPAGPDGYADRCVWLLDRGLGLWDVYQSCEREGSLDTSIRNAQVNDFRSLLARVPALAAIAHNGGESFRHARAVRASLGVDIPSLRLPSTSPANASWSFEKKLNAWRDAFAPFGLL